MPSLTMIKIGIIVFIAIAAFGWHQYDRGIARLEGERAERLVWTELQARARAAAEIERQKDQAAINAAEADYLKARAEGESRSAELTKALDHEKSLGRACAAVSRELRDKLNAIGRRS